jgi:hypothetical protein
MVDDPNRDDNDLDVELRPITTRLVDLQRKCRSVGTRDQEAADMEARIGSVLDRLAVDRENDDPIPFAALVRELYPVERFFESNGFLSVAKEVAHVERALESFASPEELRSSGVVVPRSETGRDDDEPGDGDSAIDQVEEPPSRWAVPKPVAVVGVLFVLAMAVCAVLIIRHQTASDQASRAPVALPTSPPVTPLPTSTPAPSPTPRPNRLAPGARLAEEIGQARLALSEGDLESAINHISAAALIDSDHTSVLAAARQVVDQLVNRADAAADSGLWETAELTLARADRIATRFGLDTQAIVDAAHRHSQMDRFRLLRTEQHSAIRAAAGQRVTVFMKDGSTQEAVINGVDRGLLLLDEDTTVRGGTMYYVERIPLSDIDYLKVWED